MLPLRIWSPLEQYPDAFDETCPKCSSTLPEIFEAMDWCDGHAPNRLPRLVHDIDCCCLLVNRVYRCKNGYIVLGHHPYIIYKLF